MQIKSNKVPITGSRISQIGEGAAQVFQPYESKYGAQVAAIGQAKEKTRQKRESDIYKDLGSVNIEGIFYKHQPVFAQKQKQLYDYVKTNIDALRKGDADKTIEYQNMLTKLGTDIGLSKNAATGYKELFTTYIKDQNKYRPDIEEYLHGFTGYDPATDQFETPDFAQLKSQIDLGKDFQSTVLPQFEKAKTEGQISWDNPDGSVSTKKTSELTQNDVNYIVTGRLKDPVVFEQAIYDYTKENPNNPNPSNEDIQGYYYEKYAKPFVKKESFVTKTEGSAPKEGGLQIGLGSAKSGKFYYSLESPTSAKAGGKSIIVFGQEGGTPLPFNSFEGAQGKEIIGRPTGKIYNIGKGDNFEMEMLVPKKQESGLSLDISTMTPETNPDKYEKIFIPLTKSEVNKKKFQGEYGGYDIDELYKQMAGKKEEPKKEVKKQEDFRKKYNY